MPKIYIMKAKDSQVFKINDYLVKNLFDVDEFILKLSSYISEGQGFDAEMIKSNIKRIYFTFEIEKTKGIGKKYIDGTEKVVSKKFYDENNDFFNTINKDLELATSLNYNDFFTLNPLIEIVNYSQTPFELEPFEFVDLIKDKVLDTNGDTSKSMILSKFIGELDRSYKYLEQLLVDSLIPLNKIQEAVIQRHLYFNKEVFRLLLIEFLSIFSKAFSELNYASEVFEVLYVEFLKSQDNKDFSDYEVGFKTAVKISNYNQILKLLTDTTNPFIKKETSLSMLKTAFNATKNKKIDTPITWLGTKGELKEFIAELVSKGIIDNTGKRYQNHWNYSEAVFRDKEDKIITGLSNSHRTPARKPKIDKIIKSIRYEV